jgi:hypothetical protein
MTLAAITADAGRFGFAVRGAFRPTDQDGVPGLPDGRTARALVLLGWAGGSGFPAFAASPEGQDGADRPLDRYCARVVAELAKAALGAPLLPSQGPPFLPFQRWARRCEPVHVSPLGLLIHPVWGLWHSYRGAIALAEEVGADEVRPGPRPSSESPCLSCETRPCLTACPVGAFSSQGYDVEACADHLRGEAGQPCRAGGCLARLACPIGAEHRYGPEQAAFHFGAFMAARGVG